MKRISPALLLIILVVLIAAEVQAQGALQSGEARPRRAHPASAQDPQPSPSTRQLPPPDDFETDDPEAIAPAADPAATSGRRVQAPATLRLLTPLQIQTRTAEAERLLKSRPLRTALTLPSIEFVTLAALDRTTSRLHLVTFSKETFLTKSAEVTMTSSLGTPLSVRILRANGVNTAVTIFDSQGRSYFPLVVEYPIEKRGVFREMAYYTSAHPALLSPDLTREGRAYVRRMIDLAAKRLREKGKFINPNIVDAAERLCLVEHVDHERFRAENRLQLYDEIYSLFALNELNTYRYSVSSAGAGGMVQMIPWAYNLMKQRHPGVGLTPDFVVGMRNHANALQAMLLYMQDTWNDLAASEDVQYALSAKLATQTELLAAGYNSNAARLPLYIRRGGSGWRTLIPRETQMYLQIYKSVEGLVPQKSRTGSPASSLSQKPASASGARKSL